jgi:hypothetical protein
LHGRRLSFEEQAADTESTASRRRLYVAVVDFLAEAGVDAIIPADLVGEVLSLTLDERRAVLAESV